MLSNLRQAKGIKPYIPVLTPARDYLIKEHSALIILEKKMENNIEKFRRLFGDTPTCIQDFFANIPILSKISEQYPEIGMHIYKNICAMLQDRLSQAQSNVVSLFQSYLESMEEDLL